MTVVRTRTTSTPAARATTLRRRPGRFTVVRNWADVLRVLREEGAPRLLVADVDPAVAGYRAGPQELLGGMARVDGPPKDALEPGGALVWASNARRPVEALGATTCSPGGHLVLFGAGKPRLQRLRHELGPRLDA